MSESFGAAALRLSGLAARLLGWRPHEFWAATPAELAAAVAPADPGPESLARADLQRLMENEHDGYGRQPAD